MNSNEIENKTEKKTENEFKTIPFVLCNAIKK